MKVTILSGFLGSGKTTLLRRLLRHNKDLRLGIMVNDMSELEVDADLVRVAHRVSETEGNLVSLFAGSISGDRRAAFQQALASWQERMDLDYLIVETSGSTHPWPLIEELKKHEAYQLDSFVTLLDAKAFIEDYAAGRRLFEKLIQNEERGVRSVENLLAEQIQYASTILLTKTDRVRAEDLPFLLKCLEILNPHAQVHVATYGEVSKHRLLGTELFSWDRAQVLARNLKKAESEDWGAASGYDISSTVICDPRPLHPQRLWDLYHQKLGQKLHRSKGFLWLASREDLVLLFNQAAGGIDLELLAYWKASLVKDPLGKLSTEEKVELGNQLKTTHPIFGDRMCELTIIGALHDREAFVRGLQDCFCTEAEILHWCQGGHFNDPWPQTVKQML